MSYPMTPVYPRMAMMICATAMASCTGGAVEVEQPRRFLGPRPPKKPYPAEQPRQAGTTHGPRQKRNRKAQRAERARKGKGRTHHR